MLTEVQISSCFSTVLFSSFPRHRGLLRWAALFLGELRDGLTMINMQSAFLIVSKQYTEKQAGVLFFGKYEIRRLTFVLKRAIELA